MIHRCLQKILLCYSLQSVYNNILRRLESAKLDTCIVKKNVKIGNQIT